MAEQKAKSTAKKVTTGTRKNTVKADNVAAAKPKTAKTASAATVKKTTAKKAAAPASTTAKAKPPAAKKAPAKKAATVATKATGNVKRQAPTPEERYRMIQTAAYFIAERNGFQGCSIGHWEAAEKEVDERLRQSVR